MGAGRLPGWATMSGCRPTRPGPRVARRAPAARGHLERASTNFAVFAPEATSVDVCLFDDGPDGLVETRHRLTEHTLGIWHGALPGVPVGQRYGFRADGPWEPERGRRFNPAKLLLDPYARAVAGDDPAHRRGLRPRPARPAATPTGSRRPSCTPATTGTPRRTCRSPSSCTTTSTGATTAGPRHRLDRHGRLRAARQGLHPAARPGPRGAARDVRRARLPRRRRLPPATSGITTVELLPVHQFVSERHLTDVGLTNYWGYNSIGYFAPHDAYSSRRRPRRAGHRVQADGPEPARGRPRGDPRRGLQPHRRGRPRRADALLPRARRLRLLQARRTPATTPTSTSPAAATPSTRPTPTALRLILDSLRYWVTEMHVDGFRFDLDPGAGPRPAPRSTCAAPSSPRSARTRCCGT